jgi:hypothetical protein
MLFNRTPTDEARHRRNNELQHLVTKQQAPDIYARWLAKLDPDARATIEATVARLEREEGGRS